MHRTMTQKSNNRPFPKATPRAVAGFLLAVFLGFSTLLGPTSAQAQVFKPQGFTLPGFLFSPSERRAREACAEERPECRPSIRAEMEHEMSISLLVPWVALGLAILAVLLWLRLQERKKMKLRYAARARHDPAKFRKLDREQSERKKDEDDDEAL